MTQRTAVEELRQANVALVRTFIDAFNDSWDVEALPALVAEDFVFVTRMPLNGFLRATWGETPPWRRRASGDCAPHLDPSAYAQKFSGK